MMKFVPRARPQLDSLSSSRQLAIKVTDAKCVPSLIRSRSCRAFALALSRWPARVEMKALGRCNFYCSVLLLSLMLLAAFAHLALSHALAQAAFLLCGVVVRPPMLRC